MENRQNVEGGFDHYAACLFEMKIDDDIPVSVAINEAVELAKKFGGDDSPSFVNGILAKLTD